LLRLNEPLVVAQHSNASASSSGIGDGAETTADGVKTAAEPSPPLPKSQSEGSRPTLSSGDSNVLNMPQDRNPSTGASSLMAEAISVIQELSPLPKSKTSRKRTRQVEGAEVITGSSYKQRVLEKAEKKSSKSQVKNKMPRKKKLTCRLDKPIKKATRPQPRACDRAKKNCSLRNT